ncbi:hypothetical protein [Lusitaniella coriacea]|uniref:hypothetical protein n=1 Tax=Lusitaniella coriacea TaxID=1983105 RepID=UPI003CED66E1
MSILKKIITLPIKSWWGKIMVFQLFTGISCFVSVFIQTIFLKSKSFTEYLFGFSVDSSFHFPISLFFAIISISLFYISTIFKFNSSIQESISGLAAIVSILGISIIFFFGLADPKTRFLQFDTQNLLLSIIFRASEYLFFSTIYLFSVIGAYMFFYLKNKE